MDDVVAQSEAPRCLNAIIISSFVLAAVLLAVLGIYSVIEFSTAKIEKLIAFSAVGRG